MRRYILTGTPSAGKSTIIHDLASRNYAVVHEAATDVIKAEHQKGNWEPWNQKQSFIKKVVDLQKQRQNQILQQANNIVFFDRSPICTFALCIFMGFNPPQSLMQEIDCVIKANYYQKHVFFVENLGFCERNKIRKITFDECLKFEEIYKKVYKKYGFELLIIKPASVAKRSSAIIDYI